MEAKETKEVTETVEKVMIKKFTVSKKGEGKWAVLIDTQHSSREVIAFFSTVEEAMKCVYSLLHSAENGEGDYEWCGDKTILTIEQPDKLLKNKLWLIRRSKCGHWFLTYSVFGNVKDGVKRVSKKELKERGLI